MKSLRSCITITPPAEPGGPAKVGTPAAPGPLVRVGSPAAPRQPPTVTLAIRRTPIATIMQMVIAILDWRPQLGDRVEMPRVIPNTRAMLGPLLILLFVDCSGSTNSTDPDAWRWWAVRKVARWMQRGHRSDRIVVATFDDEVDVGTLRRPAAVALNPTEGLPQRKGGTLYNPIIDAALEVFDTYPSYQRGLVIVTDGMATDASSAAARLRALNLHATIIPFGKEWPQIAGDWDGLDVLRIYQHPGANTRQIARSIALGVLSHTGELVR